MKQPVDPKLTKLFKGTIVDFLKVDATTVAVRLQYGSTFSTATVGPNNKRTFFQDCPLQLFLKG